ncbi:Uncharacterized protein TCM_025579 [Theobroma cacao]|uniref:Uncharacterized protein n=1 Tax=Theobroma cacao TaxID=3641 RepID=A0A061F011_THECC|nr:Uncharacterized protein TCM_025579 [Theobroma cacao]
MEVLRLISPVRGDSFWLFGSGLVTIIRLSSKGDKKPHWRPGIFMKTAYGKSLSNVMRGNTKHKRLMPWILYNQHYEVVAYCIT